MSVDNRGIGRITLIVAVALLGVSGAAAIGVTIGSEDPTGEEVLEEAYNQYDEAETVSIDATVTVSNETTEIGTYEVQTVVTDDNQSIVTASYDNQSVTGATTAEYSWIHPEDGEYYLQIEQERAAVYTLTGAEVASFEYGNITDEFTGNLSEEKDWENITKENVSQETIEEALDEIDQEFELNESFGEIDGDLLLNDSKYPLFGNNGEESNITGGDALEMFSANASMYNLTEKVEAIQEHEMVEKDLESVIENISEEAEQEATAFEEGIVIERTETTEYNGEDVHVVSVTHEDESIDGELTYWVTTDEYHIVKQELTTAIGNITAEFDTEIDRDIADSTFEPPEQEQEVINSYIELQDQTQFEFVPEVVNLQSEPAQYEFDSGTVVTIPEIGGQVASAVYQNETASVAVIQSSIMLDEWVEGTETTINNESVTVVNASELTEIAADIDSLGEITDGSAAIWTDDEIMTVVVGDKSEQEIEEIAADLIE